MVVLSCKQQKSNVELENNFKNPPPEARPRTWMHSMSSNMSKEGFTKDLEAMADAGIGGIILFNVTTGKPKKGKVIFNSHEHIEMTAHAAKECERLGLTFGIHNCDGWTSSGGPWVTPEHSMKQLTFSQQIVKGGKVKVNLETPSSVANFYQDVAVIAYPSLVSELADENNQPSVKSSDKKLNISIINDGKIEEKTTLKVEKEGVEWVEFQYSKPFRANSIYLNFHTRVSREMRLVLKVSDDGINYTKAAELKPLRMGKIEHGVDMILDNIQAKYFRIEAPVSLDISEISLSAVKKFDNILARTSLFKLENHRIPSIEGAKKDAAIRKEDILNLSTFMDENGLLQTELPKGDWTIMRFGYTITGAVNGPASEEGRGWEVDKMSRESFKIFYEGYVRNVIDASKKVAPNALQYIEIDSYEVGGQNWTKDYQSFFKEELGYDIIEYLPLYAGRYIDNADTTERILWDVRNFNSKLMTDNYFDYFTELCHKDGLISYVEPYSFNAGFNELDATKKVDIPMGEFWMHQRYQAETAVSGARIYGKNIVSAESFSAQPNINWKGHPGTLKLTGDKAWTLGINEFFFHRFTHQSNTHVMPGLTMYQWGSHIDRTQTWWYNAGKAWFKYLARGQYILRQGIPVSNLLVFVGDGSPNSIVHRRNLKIKKQTNFDCINADALINRISVKDKTLNLPNGIQYHGLHLTNTKEMRLSTLKKIAELAQESILIVGAKPKTIGGHNNSDIDKNEFDRLVDLVWSKPTTYEKADWDELFANNNVPVDLKISNGEEIEYIHRKTKTEDIYFFYNPTDKEKTFDCTFNVDGKIPELWNQMTGETTKLGAFKHKNGQTQVAISFPAEGSGFIVFRESSKGVKSVDPKNALNNKNLRFTLNTDNVIQVESNQTETLKLELSDGTKKSLDIEKLPDNVLLKNAWNVEFPDTKSGGRKVVFDSLMDWTHHANEEIKHYSGTANYETTFTIHEKMLVEGIKCRLDLGEVNIAARVFVNGKDIGMVWTKPYVIDISSAIQLGENTLKIEVTNQWTNRLIGDEHFPDATGYHDDKSKKMPDWFINNEPAPLKQRSTFTTFNFYTKDSELIPAGLVGPVKLIFSKKSLLK